MVFSNDSQYVLSSGIGERYIAIWKLGGDKTRSSNCVLSMEHPAIFVDCKRSDEGEIHVLAISEIGVCYFWSASNVDGLRNKKPTKISVSESSLSRAQAFSIFAAKLQRVDGPTSAHVLLAYGSVVKPSFDKLLVCYGTDINLGISQDGVLLPNIQTTLTKKDQSVKKQGIIILFVVKICVACLFHLFNGYCTEQNILKVLVAKSILAHAFAHAIF
jgi:U3 small nucleolar RNA-associated protein 5